MRKFFKWVASFFKKEPNGQESIAEMANTVISVGKGNTTTVHQVKVIKSKLPLGLTEKELREISQKAVREVAKKKLVTTGREERIREWLERDREAVKTAPSQDAKPLSKDSLKKAVAANKARSRNDAVRRDDDPISTTTIGSPYNTVTTYSAVSSSSHHSSDDGGSYSSGSCDSGSSSSCD